MGKVGYLWDSLSPNTGDRTLGLSFLRLAKQAGLRQIDPVTIGPQISDNFDTLVIGGGELLHPPGDPFYDLFRVPGRHILNTVGTKSDLDARHLNDYRLVSVRSTEDRSNLSGFGGEATVAPCLSVLFNRIAVSTERPVPSERAMGIHLQPASVAAGGIRRFLHTLGSGVASELQLFSFTPYNKDGLIADHLAGALELAPPLYLDDPDTAFEAIERFECVFVTSLHATIMAYVAGVPFLAFAYSPKVSAFLQARGLGARAVLSLQDVESKLGLLAKGSVDWSDRLAEDQQQAAELLDRILTEVEAALIEKPRGRSCGWSGWTEPTHPVQAHSQQMAIYAEYGNRVADQLLFEMRLEAQEEWLASLESSRQNTERELHQLAEYAVSLEEQLRQQKEEYSKCADHSRALEQQAQGHLAHVRGLEGYVHQLEDDLARSARHQEELNSYVKQLLRQLDRHREHQQEVAGYVERLQRELANAQSRSEPSDRTVARPASSHPDVDS